jgi:dihydroorotase
MIQTFGLIIRVGEVVNHAGRGFTDVVIRDDGIVLQGASEPMRFAGTLAG